MGTLSFRSLYLLSRYLSNQFQDQLVLYAAKDISQETEMGHTIMMLTFSLVELQLTMSKKLKKEIY